MRRTAQVVCWIQCFILKPSLGQSLNTFSVGLKETGSFFINKTKTGWSTLQRMKKLIINFKRNVVCLLLALRTFTELSWMLSTVSPFSFHYYTLLTSSCAKLPKTSKTRCQIYGYHIWLFCIVYICMQSHNFKKVHKTMCRVKYILYMWLN